jgi:hypothetical protein
MQQLLVGEAVTDAALASLAFRRLPATAPGSRRRSADDQDGHAADSPFPGVAVALVALVEEVLTQERALGRRGDK